MTERPLRCLIDTDRVIDALTGDAGGIALLRALRPSGIAISIVTYVEVFEGVVGSRDRPRAEEVFRAFLRGTPVVGIDQAVAERAAMIRSALRQRRRSISERAMDLLIAATAVELGLTLVSRNVRDFGDIPELRLLHDASP